jgi:multidrug efflux pump subunit AcrB
LANLNFKSTSLRDRAADLGVSALDIAQAINTFVGGQKISTFTGGTNDDDITLRAEQPFRTSLEEITQVPIPSTRARHCLAR